MRESILPEEFEQEEDAFYHDTSTFSKLKAALQQGLLPFAVERAGDAPAPKLYYGALSVAVETIALLLFVEAFRRKLDNLAEDRPIFMAVLDGVYRELATLGIVELFIHLLHEYYDDLDTAKEAVFVDVHFVFFYTAIFNALQSTLMAILAHKVSYHTWVRTEELELNHYVEIREEFDRVRQKLYGDHAPYSYESYGGGNVLHSIKNFSDNLQKGSARYYASTVGTNSDNSFVGSIKRFCHGIYYTFKYPRLKAKHDALLIQVRFHELRVHFLQAYDLPHKLKVSTYLMRSLQAVLKHLIHISTTAWLWLTGMINVLYFVTGMVADITQDADSAGVTLAVAFILEMGVFILASLLVYQRMQIIFMQIMEMKHLWDIDGTANQEKEGPDSVDYNDGPLYPTNNPSTRFRDPSLASEQLSLFFLGDPKIVIISIQFMQFGYAIALSVVVVYWEEMNKANRFGGTFYLFVTLGCYTIFLIIMAQTLVRFTMATSLGQLVDRKRLYETVALFRLEEAERRRQQAKEMNVDFYLDTALSKAAPRAAAPKPVEESAVSWKAPEGATEEAACLPLAAMKPDAAVNEESTSFREGDQLEVCTAPLTSELLLQVPGNENEATDAALPAPTVLAAIPEKQAAIEPDKATLLMDLVKMDTDSLRKAVPLDEIRMAERRDRRRNRRKSVSDGVALMSAIGKVGNNVLQAAGEVGNNVLQAAGGVVNTSATSKPTLSATIGETDNNAKYAPFRRNSTEDNITKTPPAPVPGPQFAVDDSALVKRRDRRANRKKAVSASAAIQQMRDFTLFGSGAAEDSRTGTADSRAVTDAWSSAKSPNIDGSAPKTVDDSALIKQRERRANRKKAVSASAAIQQMRDFTGFGTGGTEEQKEPEDATDVWGHARAPNTAAALKRNSDPKMALVSKPQVSADDSSMALTATRQRRERRKNRQKALSASAAVRLMRDASGGEDEILREKESMMEFWAISKHSSVPEGDEDATENDDMNDDSTPRANASLESLQQSELLLQNQSFLASVQESNNNNAMLVPAMPPRLPPVKEVSHASMEDDSNRRDYARTTSYDLSPEQQKEPPALNMLAPSQISPMSSGDATEPKRTSFLLQLPRIESEEASPVKIGWVDDNDSDGTVDTDRSVGGLSHVGDVSDMPYSANSFVDDDDDEGVTFAERWAHFNAKMRRFYQSQRYGFVTHLFGTMVCFFLIGMRVEGFLKEQCIIPLDDATWELPLKSSFWLIVAYMCFFILSSVWRIVLFPACLDRPEPENNDEDGPARPTKKQQWIMLVASLIDLIICLTCFMVFLGAEIERCCDGNEYPSDSSYHYGGHYDDDHADHYGSDYDHNDTQSDYDGYGGNHEPATEGDYSHRFLAGGSDYGYEAEPAVCVDTTSYCNCPKFGTRVEGGLGAIEPWSALIVFRTMRFILAKQIVQRFDVNDEFEEVKHDEDADGGKSQSHGHLTSHAGHGGGGNAMSGTAVELWQAAVAQHPDIVDRYGEFSGELLQAMLGVEVTGSLKPPPTPKSPRQFPSSPAGSEGAPIGGGTSGGGTSGGAVSGRGILRRSDSSFEQMPNEVVTLEEKKYCKLAPEVQEIIVAGKLGCPVRCNAEGMLSRDPSSPNLAGLMQPEVGLPIEFAVDRAQMEIDRLESTSAFEYPNARLVRSMRRCERKLLPLLSHWSPVDVVITNHEIVYVHTTGSDGSEDDLRLTEAGRQALVATKGGKGLRLCDVTAGRRVIGHMSFSDILTVHVERVPRLPGSVHRSAVEAAEEMNHGRVEFWQDKLENDREESPVDRQKRWDSVHQDSLKIETIHGILYLRFYSDLEECEVHPERVIAESDEDNPVYKDIAFQWAQTIIRQCSVGQLKQPLPHFCANNDAELKDFLQIVPREEKARGRGHRRFASSVTKAPGKIHRRGRSASRGRRAKSELPVLTSKDFERTDSKDINDHPLQSPSTASPPKIPAPKKITRFASYDEASIRDITADTPPKRSFTRAQSIS